MRRSLRARSRGFTLIEGMMSSVIFMVGILGVLGSISVARRSTTIGGRQLWAAEIARDMTEQLTLIPYDHPLLQTACNHPDPADKGRGLEGAAATSNVSLLTGSTQGESAFTGNLRGIETAQLGTAANGNAFGSGSKLHFRRFICVTHEKIDGSPTTFGNEDVRARVFVIVFYVDGETPRRHVTYYVRHNPQFAR